MRRMDDEFHAKTKIAKSLYQPFIMCVSKSKIILFSLDDTNTY